MNRSPMRYPGSKAKLMKALMPHIDIMMLNRGEFCDAFIGGGSVLLEVADKYPKIKLYANDKDKWIYSFLSYHIKIIWFSVFPRVNLIKSIFHYQSE